MPLRRLVGRLVVAVVVSILASPLAARAADSASVMLRWRGSPDPSVAGYHVHVRTLHGAYGAPRDAGLPVASADGSLSVVVGGLDPRKAYAFALSAYTADGAESGLSNELTLKARRTRCAKDADCADDDACTDNERCEGGRCVSDAHVCVSGDACVEATCDASQGCVTQPMSDGATCTDGDPCVAGACTSGVCAIPAQASAGSDGHDLQSTRFTLRRHRGGLMLSAAGSFAGPDVDPVASGVVVQVLRADGGVLFEADVAGAQLRRRGRHRWTWLRNADERRLRRLRLRWDGTVADLRLKAELPATAMETSLTWAVRLADVCVRAPGLVCTEAGARVASCD